MLLALMLIHQPEKIIFLQASQQQTAYQYQSGHPKRHQPSEGREEKLKDEGTKKQTRNEDIAKELQRSSLFGMLFVEIEAGLLIRLAAGHQTLQARADVTLAGSNFEVSVDDAGRTVSVWCLEDMRRKTYVTASRIPVPLPRAPRRSEATDKAPMQAPPKAAAVGMMRLSSLYMLCSRWPDMTRP